MNRSLVISIFVLALGAVLYATLTPGPFTMFTETATEASDTAKKSVESTPDQREQEENKPEYRVENVSYTTTQSLESDLGEQGLIRTDDGETTYVVVESFPEDFDEIYSTDKKKRLFREILLPVIRLENRQIREQRRLVTRSLDEIQSDSLDTGTRESIVELLSTYEVVEDPTTEDVTADNLRALRERVHVIPASLVLAQAANESAWGTSRFCMEANNIFGEWTYNQSEGLKPEGVDESAPHRIRIFDNIRQSMRHYMVNLNTHSAYEEFRQLRADSENLNSLKLVQGLEQYSSRREAYVESVADLIRGNDYRRFDRF